MSLLEDDGSTRVAFSVYENKGVFALLLGSEISRAAQIPTDWEITLDLIRRVGLAQGVPEQTDWAQWYRDKTGAAPEYSAVIADLGLSRNERRSILHSYIEPSDEDRQKGHKLPTRAHLAIADLVRSGLIRVIMPRLRKPDQETSCGCRSDKSDGMQVVVRACLRKLNHPI